MLERNPQDLVWIYVTGSAVSSNSNELGWIWRSMLTEGQVDDVDIIRSNSTTLKGDDVQVRAEGRGLVLVTDKARLDQVMGRLRNEYNGDDLKAYALPILAALT